jgi:modulator of FtsH protease HflK
MRRDGNPLPDLEEMLVRGRDRLRVLMPGGMGGLPAITLVAAAVLVLWGLSGFYRVQADEQGVELLFGKYVGTTQPGLNYWFPAPVGSIMRPKVTQTNQITIGFRNAGGTIQEVPQESLVLTGDQNIADIQFVVQWRIGNAQEFLFNMRDPEVTVKIAAESALREVVGANTLTDVVTDQRERLAQQAREALQGIMDVYKSGVTILDLQIQKADPPKEVIDAFNDVQRAKQDGERLANEAQAYGNNIIPRARGDAARHVQSAAAEKEKLIKEAEGEAAHFTAIYKTYAENKDLTVLRMYLETMQDILGKADVIIVDQNSTGGVIPYLPLPEIRKRAQRQETAE